MKHQKIGIVLGVTAAALLAYVPAAMAKNTVKVDGTTTPPGNVSITATNKTTISFLSNFGVPGSCTNSTIAGHIKRGASAAAGTTIGAITAMTFSPCNLFSLHYPVTIAKKPIPAEWPIIVRTTLASKTQNIIDVRIDNVHAQMISTGSAPYLCHVQARGNINATFNRTTQQLVIATAPAYPLTLTAYDTTGLKGAGNIVDPPNGTCLNEFQTGDRAQMSATFTVTTPGVGGIQLN